MSSRVLMPAVLLTIALVGVLWTVRQGALEPADFTFNNATEIESLDPAVVTGQPEGRIIWSVYEGMVRLSPNDRKPEPGMALRWDISDDGLVYTFHLRRDAKWTNGDPVTADDFVYSMRRFLDPQTLAEYAYQAWYMKNARRYSRAARGVEVGDPVEVELHTPPDGALPFARGELVTGELARIDADDGVSEEDLADPAKYVEQRTFVVATESGERSFRVAGETETFNDAESCRQLMLDFREVGIRAVDEFTVETTLENPTPYWLQLLGFYPLSPVNKRCVETHGPLRWTETENLVTNGAYRVEFRRLRDRIRLRKNPDYWDAENVALETIDALAVQSPTTAFNLYETGQVDWIEKVGPLISRELLSMEPPREDLNPAAQLGTYFYSYNCSRPPLDDVRVRQALSLAIDREEIIATAGAGELPAFSYCPPGLPGYESPQCKSMQAERAKQLLADAGYPGGAGFPKIDILYNFRDDHQTIAELVRKQWRRTLGIDVATRNEEWGTYLSSQRQLKYDVVRRAWIGDYLDPNTFLDMYVTGGENNNTGWSNEEYDQLIRDAKTEIDPEKRLEILRQAEVILMREMPVLPIYFYVSRNLVRPHVRGFYNNLQDSHPLRALSIDRDAPAPNEYIKATAARHQEGQP